jgi:predicted outer membrane repeat protein
MIIAILLFSVNATYYYSGESLTKSTSPCGTSINGIFNEDSYLDLARVPGHVKNNGRVLNYGNSNFDQIYINIDGDDSNSGTTMNDPVQTLQKAMELVNNGGIIDVLSDLYVPEKNDTSNDPPNQTWNTINVSKNITIRSETDKKMINGHGHQIFNIDHSVKVNVAINNLKLVNGYSITNGGTIFNNGSDLNLSDCIIDSNEAEEDGGGVFITGGGISHIINCSFTNNKASNRGGGISITKTNTRCYINNCNFTNNQASDGGGIHLGQDNNPPIFNCSISNNSAGRFGGGVYVNLGFGNFTNCSISDNSASDGGGVNINEGLSRFTTCNFTNNHADFDGGGIGILNGSGFFILPIIKDNIANNNGGGMKNNDLCEIYGGDVFNNTASGYGGGIYNDGYNKLTITNITINNSENIPWEHDPRFIGNKASDGGAIYNLGLFGTVYGLVIQDNTALGGGGGGIAIWSREDYNYLRDYTKSACVFNNNKPDNLELLLTD